MNVTVSLWSFIPLCVAALWGVTCMILAMYVGMKDYRNKE